MPRQASHELTSPALLPALSDHDTALLTLYLTDVNTHLPAFAIKSCLGMVAAIAFLARPDIARYVSTFHRLRENTQRMTALNYLREIVETSEDPVEQRRAASTLLRALTPSRTEGAGGGLTSRPNLPPIPPTPPSHTPSSLPSEGRAGEGLANTSGAHQTHASTSTKSHHAHTSNASAIHAKPP